MAYSKKTQQAVKKYGVAACQQAYYLHSHEGYGAAGIAQNYALNGVRTTGQADAAINAGREIAGNA